jgi:hypothetical protein
MGLPLRTAVATIGTWLQGPRIRLAFRLLSHGIAISVSHTEILDVRGEDGGPPYLVRWADDGHIGLIHPGPDAVLDHLRSGADAA